MKRAFLRFLIRDATNANNGSNIFYTRKQFKFVGSESFSYL